MQLSGRVSLVTGGAGGIGAAICEKLAALGSFIYVCDLRGAQRVVSRINKTYGEERASAADCDIADRDAVEAMYERVASQRGGVDILVNNAAVYGPLEGHEFPRLSYQDFARTIGVDLSGAFYCTALALPHMRRQGWGRILFSAAPMSSSAIPSPYLAGKAGFMGMTRYLSKRYGDQGIHTFALALRHVDTPMIRKVMRSRGHDPEQAVESLHRKALTGRMITPAEIADLYAHVVCSGSAAESGTVVLADGGITYLR